MNPKLKTEASHQENATLQLCVALSELSRYGRLVYLSLLVLPEPPSEELLSAMSGLDLADVRMILEELIAHTLVRTTKRGLVPLRFF